MLCSVRALWTLCSQPALCPADDSVAHSLLRRFRPCPADIARRDQLAASGDEGVLSGDSLDLERASGAAELTPHAPPSPRISAASGAAVGGSAAEAAGGQQQQQQQPLGAAGSGSTAAVSACSSGALPESPFHQPAGSSVPAALGSPAG